MYATESSPVASRQSTLRSATQRWFWAAIGRETPPCRFSKSVTNHQHSSHKSGANGYMLWCLCYPETSAQLACQGVFDKLTTSDRHHVHLDDNLALSSIAHLERRNRPQVKTCRQKLRLPSSRTAYGTPTTPIHRNSTIQLVPTSAKTDQKLTTPLNSPVRNPHFEAPQPQVRRHNGSCRQPCERLPSCFLTTA